MGKKVFDRIKKTMCILMLVFFVTSVTVASVSAAPLKSENRRSNKRNNWTMNRETGKKKNRNGTTGNTATIIGNGKLIIRSG